MDREQCNVIPYVVTYLSFKWEQKGCDGISRVRLVIKRIILIVMFRLYGLKAASCLPMDTQGHAMPFIVALPNGKAWKRYYPWQKIGRCGACCQFWLYVLCYTEALASVPSFLLFLSGKTFLSTQNQGWILRSVSNPLVSFVWKSDNHENDMLAFIDHSKFKDSSQ